VWLNMTLAVKARVEVIGRQDCEREEALKRTEALKRDNPEALKRGAKRDNPEALKTGQSAKRDKKRLKRDNPEFPCRSAKTGQKR